MSSTPLQHFISERWQAPSSSDVQIIQHAIHGGAIASVSNEAIDFENVLKYGRETGNVKLRRMTFQERGMMLKRLALH